MKPSEAKANYGATHYLPLKDDPLKPSLYYKRKETKWNDGTTTNNWHYLSFANIWFPSDSIDDCDLVKISDKLSITHTYSQTGGNYFFSVFLNGCKIFEGAGYYECMIEVVQEFKTQYENFFKGPRE